MFRNKMLFSAVILGFALPSAFAMGTSELSKIKNQIKQTEQKNKQIEQQLKTARKNVEKTKKD